MAFTSRESARHAPHERTAPADLTDVQADAAIEVMSAYYEADKPVCGAYFGHLNNFLDGLGASYRERSATHLDLVQESTDPVWSGLGQREQAALLARDLPFLRWQLSHLPALARSSPRPFSDEFICWLPSIQRDRPCAVGVTEFILKSDLTGAQVPHRPRLLARPSANCRARTYRLSLAS